MGLHHRTCRGSCQNRWKKSNCSVWHSLSLGWAVIRLISSIWSQHKAMHSTQNQQPGQTEKQVIMLTFHWLELAWLQVQTSTSDSSFAAENNNIKTSVCTSNHLKKPDKHLYWKYVEMMSQHRHLTGSFSPALQNKTSTAELNNRLVKMEIVAVCLHCEV